MNLSCELTVTLKPSEVQTLRCSAKFVVPLPVRSALVLAHGTLIDGLEVIPGIVSLQGKQNRTVLEDFLLNREGQVFNKWIKIKH